MCEPASFVLTEKEAYWSKKTDSHTDIMAERNLREGIAGKIMIAKIEIQPPRGADGLPDFFAPADKWGYHLDMDRAPDWYDEEREEKRARRALKDWIKAGVFQDLEVDEFNPDAVVWIKDCNIGSVNGGTINDVRGGTINDVRGGTINAVNGGTINDVRGGTINDVRGQATVQTWQQKHGLVPKESAVVIVRAHDKAPQIITAAAEQAA